MADDPRLVEVHPELSFAELAGTGPLARRRHAAGRAARLALLRGWLPGAATTCRRGDDGLDALAAAWSARRWLAGRARTLPEHPPYDERGRPMRIVT